MDSLKYLLVILGLIGLIVVIGLLVKFFRKSPKKGIIITLSVLCLFFMGFTAFLVKDIIKSLIKNTTTIVFATAPETGDVIPGKLTLFGEEITLPCSVADLEKKGFSTSELEWSNGKKIEMWHGEERGESNAVWVYKDTSNDTPNYAYTIHEGKAAAIFIPQSADFAIGENDYAKLSNSLTTLFPEPAHKKEKSDSDGREYIWYLGENNMMYRFEYQNDKLVGILAGTVEYVKNMR